VKEEKVLFNKVVIQGMGKGRGCKGNKINAISTRWRILPSRGEGSFQKRRGE